jgi:hypothetical protein
VSPVVSRGWSITAILLLGIPCAAQVQQIRAPDLAAALEPFCRTAGPIGIALRDGSRIFGTVNNCTTKSITVKENIPLRNSANPKSRLRKIKYQDVLALLNSDNGEVSATVLEPEARGLSVSAKVGIGVAVAVGTIYFVLYLLGGFAHT